MDDKKSTLDDKIKVLLLPFIVGGAGLGSYKGYSLKSSLESEVEARKILERKADILEERLIRRIERLEDRINGSPKRW